ncbi:MAG TPA: glycine--tRNA ligase, partial [Dehalococcoidia bacterium]|nr:glycine--tRNA ligase [Dehalococcoidia bacterium]
MAAKADMEKLVSLCKRRGFIFPGSEIYGGLGAFWDYGPLGVELKSNVRRAWWRAMVQERDDVVGLDSAILMHPQTWVASGHVQGFTDPLVECKSCHLRWREDMAKDGRCPSCGGELTEPRMFNLMFRTHVGPVEEDSTVVYLRPETAQGIFLNFQNILASSRKKVPFGIAQIGKAFRNEISPGNFIFRTREFEQMEMEYFVRPGTDEEWFKYWVEERFKWYLSLGIKKQNLRLRLHGKEELAHYAKDCHDVEYLFPMGWSELEGIANRGDFDLRQHSQSSGKALDYFDEETGQHFIPYVIEPSAGVDRTALALLVDAYDEEPDKEGIRVVLRFKFSMAPVQVAVLPLSRKENLVKLAQELYARLRKSFRCQYDDAQSIGRRYRRQDEIGTPLCVTVDFQSLEDHMATLRHRDSMEQIRVPIATLEPTLSAKLEGEAFLTLQPGGQV